MIQRSARGGAASCALVFLALWVAACSSGGSGNNDGNYPKPPPPPTSDDWVTYQGNASHTGYVPVTLDPATFSERYVVTLASVPLNPVACAGDWVYVTNSVYNIFYNKAKMFALNALTGKTNWFVLFGDETYSIDPPAYDKGRVFFETAGRDASYLYAYEYDAKTLRFQVEYMSQGDRYYAPTPFGDVAYVAGGYFNAVYAVNVAIEALLWNVNLDDFADQWTPAVDADHVYLYQGGWTGTSTEGKLSVLDRTTGAVAFEIANPDDTDPEWSYQAPVLGSLGNVLLTNGDSDNGRLISFDLAGRAIGYALKDKFTGQVTLANGTIYVFNGSRVEARREADGAFLWSWEPPALDPPWWLVWTTIATDNLLFVSCMPWNYPVYPGPGVTFAVDLATHQTVWTYPHRGQLALNAKGILFIATYGGQLAAVQVK